MSSSSDSDLSLNNLLKECSDESMDESLPESFLDGPLSSESGSPTPKKTLNTEETKLKRKRDTVEEEYVCASFTKRRYLLDCVIPQMQFPNEEQEEQEEGEVRDQQSPKATLKQMFQYDTSKASAGVSNHSTMKRQQTHSDSSDEDSSSDLETVPKRLMRKDVCELCDVVFTNERQATSHYEGQPHHKKKQHYLQTRLLEHEKEMAKKSSRAIKGPNAIVKRTKESSNEEDTQDPWKCLICSVQLNSAQAARAHYSGKSHKRREQKYQDYLEESQPTDDLRERLNRKRRERERERKHKHHKKHHHSSHHRRHSHSS